MKNSDNIQYLLCCEEDTKWGLTVSAAGYQNIEPNSLYPPVNHPDNYLFSLQSGRILNEYQLIYYPEGEGFFESASYKKNKVAAGDMILLFPNEWHRYAPTKTVGWSEYWLGFSGKIIDECVQNAFFKKQNPVFHIGIQENVVQLYRQAINVANTRKSGCQQLLSGIVSYLLGYVFAQDKQSDLENKKTDNFINKACIIMQEHFHADIKPEEVAQRVNMGYSLFRRVFKKYTGLAPAQYIRKLKLQKSKVLLLNTDMKCKEIAFAVGFDFPEHFGYAFKQETGISPEAFRAKSQHHKSTT